MEAHKGKIERVQKHGILRRGIENANDATLVTQSFRDIDIAKGIFDVNTSADYTGVCRLTDRFQTGTMLRVEDIAAHVEDMAEDILRMLKEEATRERTMRRYLCVVLMTG
jgi:hypothetical protein